MPITLDLDAGVGHGPMYLVVRLGQGNNIPPIPPFNANDPPHVKAQRIGGYWPMGLGQNGKAERVHNALGVGRPVYAVATWMAHVIQVMQVSMQPSMPIGNPEVDLLNNSFVPLPVQPTVYEWPRKDDAVWACRYLSPQVGTKTRILLAPTNDLAWIGETLVWGANVDDGFWNYSYSTPFQAPLPVP